MVHLYASEIVDHRHSFLPCQILDFKECRIKLWTYDLSFFRENLVTLNEKEQATISVLRHACCLCLTDMLFSNTSNKAYQQLSKILIASVREDLNSYSTSVQNYIHIVCMQGTSKLLGDWSHDPKKGDLCHFHVKGIF